MAMEQPLSMLLSANPTAVLALVAVVALLVLNHLISPWRSPHLSRRRLPPSPTSLPVIGHLHLLRPPVHRTFHELAARHGPLMHIRLGSTHCIVASSADIAGELIRSHEATILGRPITAVAGQFGYGAAGLVFAPCSPRWRFMRRLCMSELLGSRAVELLRPVRRAGMASLLRAALASAASGEAVNLTSDLIGLFNTSIIRMVAGDVPASVTDEAREVVKAVAELAGAFNVEDYVPVCRGWDLQGLRRRAAGVHGRFDALMEEMLRHKEEARERARNTAVEQGQEEPTATSDGSKDLLDILLDKAEDEAAEVKLTRDNIKAFILDMVTAGSDSTAAMVEWMLAELMNHPEAMRKVREEIDAAVGGERIAGEADLPQLPYLQAAYKETLRLHPAAPIAHRESTGELVVGGFTVPPRAAVFINVWAIGRDPAFWEDPLAFKPERFMPGGAAEGLEPRGQHFQFLPFGSGRRGCPGMGLALQSVPAVLAGLVQCFDWAAGDGSGVIDMEESDGLVCAPKHRLLLRPAARLNPFPAVV